jgi:hypothetical protein
MWPNRGREEPGMGGREEREGEKEGKMKGNRRETLDQGETHWMGRERWRVGTSETGTKE